MVSIGQCHTPPFCSVWQLGGFWGVRIVVFFSLPCQVVKYGLFSPFVLFLLTMDGYVVPFWSFFHGAPFLCVCAIRDGNTQPGHHLRWGLEFMCGHLEAKLFQEANGCVKVSSGCGLGWTSHQDIIQVHVGAHFPMGQGPHEELSYRLHHIGGHTTTKGQCPVEGLSTSSVDAQ